MKTEIADLLSSQNYDFEDFGAYSEESVDYPDVAQAVAELSLQVSSIAE